MRDILPDSCHGTVDQYGGWWCKDEKCDMQTADDSLGAEPHLLMHADAAHWKETSVYLSTKLLVK